MAKYTTEVATLFVSKLALLDTLKKMPLTTQGHYMKISESLEPDPVELIEEFGAEMFDYYFGVATTTVLMSKMSVWETYAEEFKKQFWYELWDREIGQENVLNWRRLMVRDLRKKLPMLMLDIEQLLVKDQAFVTAASEAKQTQTSTNSTEGKNNSISFNNNNNLSATATTPQDQLNFALTVKQEYALGVDVLGTGVEGTDNKTALDEGQPVAGYTFDYADNVSGGTSNSNDTSSGFSQTNATNMADTTDTRTDRSKDIFEMLEKLDGLVDGSFVNFFDDLKGSSLFIGLTN